MKCSGKTQKGTACTRNAVVDGRCKLHPLKEIKWTMTITFGDVCENHVNMQKLGEKAKHGFSLEELLFAQKNFTSLGCSCELIDLTRPGTEAAYLLVVRNAVDKILREHSSLLSKELLGLDWDKKALMKGKVVNKKARWNLCFDDIAQEPDYASGKGRVISFSSLPLLNYIKTCLPIIIGESAKDLKAEGNYYYDVDTTGLSYHGDGERVKVIAVRIGEPMALHYQWFQETKPIHDNIRLVLNNGDMYIMSEKAVGTDWLKKKIPTLRHAAGCAKYTTLV